MDVPAVALVVGTLGLVLVAAKAHGRQVRVEREAHGYHDVEFGGANPPFVEALWRKDRLLFWPSFVVLALPAVAHFWVRRDAGFPAAVAVALGAAFSAAFVVCGMRSLLRARGILSSPARRGSFAWWAAVALVAAGVGAAAAWRWP